MDLFDLVAKISLDTSDYEKNLNGADKKGSDFAKKLKNGLGTAAKVGTVAITAASTAVIGLTKSAVDEYANFEQLAGGIETLFGDSAAKVMNNASKAYKEAGMSMNEYMETSIQSAAALINSLGGDQAKAADIMSMSIIDMSDNVNKMGTSMEAVQDAYRGFSRGNFTMLDNLALGYAGTKEGMQSLLDKAMEIEKQQGRSTKFSIDNYADIVQAIHVVQEEMGVTGTTAKEAATTISGSVSAMKSAWSNLVAGLANDSADMDMLIGGLVDSVETAAGNIIPVVEKALQGIANLVEGLAPIIAEKLPKFVADVLPSILNAAMALLSAVTEVLPSIATNIISTLVTSIIENAPALIQGGIAAIAQLVKGLGEALPTLIPMAIDAILTIVDGLISNIDMLVDAAVTLILGLANGLINAIPVLLKKAPTIITKLADALIKNAPLILKAAVQLIVALNKGLIDSIPELIASAIKLVGGIIQGFLQMASQLVEYGAKFIIWIKDGFMNSVIAARDWGVDLLKRIGEGISSAWSSFISGISSKFDEIKERIQAPFDKAKEIVKSAIDFIKGLFNFKWELPKLKLPHFKISDGKKVLGITLPKIDIEWYKKAYEDPYMFNKPTVVGNKGFGDGTGGEMVYGHENLMKDIREAVADQIGGISIYLDGKLLVGGTADRMDSSLGDIQKFKLRWEGA